MDFFFRVRLQKKQEVSGETMRLLLLVSDKPLLPRVSAIVIKYRQLKVGQTLVQPSFQEKKILVFFFKMFSSKVTLRHPVVGTKCPITQKNKAAGEGGVVAATCRSLFLV